MRGSVRVAERLPPGNSKIPLHGNRDKKRDRERERERGRERERERESKRRWKRETRSSYKAAALLEYGCRFKLLHFFATSTHIVQPLRRTRTLPKRGSKCLAQSRCETVAISDISCYREESSKRLKFMGPHKAPPLAADCNAFDRTCDAVHNHDRMKSTSAKQDLGEPRVCCQLVEGTLQAARGSKAQDPRPKRCERPPGC